MKNVCYFNSVKFWGGGEKLHFEYACEFKKKDYNVYLASKKDSFLSEKGEKSGLKVYNISVGNLSFLNPLKYIRLIRFYKSQNIDTVIFSVSQDLKLGGIAAKFAKVKRIVYLRGLAVPVKNSLLNRWLMRDILTDIVANSEETKRTILHNLRNCIDEKKVKVIYHGIEVNKEIHKTEKKLDVIDELGHGIILGNAGRLTKQKGQQHLVDIAKRLKEKEIDFTLFIAGTGEMKVKLEDLIRENNLQREMVLLDFVEDIDAFMYSIDIFLLTSIWEGFGYVLVEAMVHSKPVVAFDISSNPEIVVRDKSGFLVEYPKLDSFADKVALLAKDENLRKQMGECGRKRVLDNFQLADRITEFEYYLLDKKF